MLIAGMNFATLYLALAHRSVMPYVKDPEAPWFLAVTLGSVIVISFYLWPTASIPMRRQPCAIRCSTSSRLPRRPAMPVSTTRNGRCSHLWMLFLCSFATSAGSTGGGIKMIRALLLCKQFYRELVRAMHPAAVYNVRIRGQVMPQGVLFAALSFGFVPTWSASSLLTLIMSFSGLDIISAFTAIVASINNTGPGLGSSARRRPTKCSLISRPGYAASPCCSAVSSVYAARRDDARFLAQMSAPGTLAAVSFAEAFRFWLKLGFISFGGPARADRDHAPGAGRAPTLDFRAPLPACPQLLHGAAGAGSPATRHLHRLADAPQLGRDRRRALFVLPSLLILIALSWLYVAFGHTTLVAGLFYGIKPAVTASWCTRRTGSVRAH